MMKHVRMIMLEKTMYKEKKKAVLFPTKYYSIIVDKANQLALALPHFVTKLKNEFAHVFKIHLSGILKQQKPPDLYVFL